MRSNALVFIVAAAAVLSFVASPAISAAPPQRQAPAAYGGPINGISCDAMEGTRLHIHQHLVILDRGAQLSIPSNVGQVPAKQCLYWVHTHTPDGIIHIEAPRHRTFTLGDFFDVWGQPLTKKQASTARVKTGVLKVWVDGKEYKGDPRKIPLSAHADIVIQAGPPFKTPVRFTNWKGL